MESVIGVVAIIVTDYQAVEKVNSVLHDFADIFNLPYSRLSERTAV